MQQKFPNRWYSKHWLLWEKISGFTSHAECSYAYFSPG